MPYPCSTCSPCRHPSVCLACHGDRLASLLEKATAFRIYRLEEAAFTEESVWPMPEEGLPLLVQFLARSGVVLLICGGVTCCCLKHITRRGLAVAPWISGDAPAVLAALRQNRLETLLAPGARPGLARARRIGRALFGDEEFERKPLPQD